MNYVIEQIANAGRYGDDKLVHMSSDEVAGLKNLANAYGTKITKNPQTGLDEAFNLRQFLPMIAGAALGPAGIGLSALQAGIATGVGGALITGDPLQGAMMGLGGYGGAGLGGALSSAGSAGAQAGANTAQLTAEQASTQSMNPAITASQKDVLFKPQIMQSGQILPTPEGGTQILGSNANTLQSMRVGDPSSYAMDVGNPASSIGYTSKTGLWNAPTNAGAIPPVNVIPTNPALDPNIPLTDTVMGKAGTVGEGLKGVISDAPGAREAFMSPVEQGGIGGGSGLFKSSLAASAPILNEAMQPEEMNMYSDAQSVPFESYLDRYGIRRVRPVGGYAEGGLTDASLSNKSGLGSLIDGSGDGMGDEVLAKVSPGEYIITAQAVSALGNGNTDAGAKKLDKMMDRIYKEQSGESKQMSRITDNVMPI